jgi:hypothetical protein
VNQETPVQAQQPSPELSRAAGDAVFYSLFTLLCVLTLNFGWFPLLPRWAAALLLVTAALRAIIAINTVSRLNRPPPQQPATQADN